MARVDKYAWQPRALEDLPGMLLQFRRVVAVAPTGSGKTTVGARLVTGEYAGERVLWVAHRNELLRQAYDRLLAEGVPQAELGYWRGTRKVNADARVLVCSVDMFRGGKEVPKARFIVIDEAHRAEAATYQDVIDRSDADYVLGLTATPWRMDGKGLRVSFNYLHVMATQSESIAAGVIAKPITYGIPRDKAKALVAKVAKQHGDYNSKQLGAVMSKRRLMGDSVSECARLAPGERTIVFAVNRDHGKKLAARFKESGRPVEYLDGETPESERHGILNRLRSGHTEVVVNVDVLSEGFDCPAVKCICIARPTKSLTRFLQYCGRASRPYKNKRPIILDHGGNTWLWGLPEKDWPWSLDPFPKNTGEAPTKVCACGVVIPASCMECPECGAVQPVAEEDEIKAAAEKMELERIGAERARRLSVLREIAKENGKGDDWVARNAPLVGAA